MRGKFYNVFLAILFSFLCGGCTEEWLEEPYSNTPLGVFDAIWDEYDKTYGAFEVKNINWDSCRMKYRIQLTSESSNDKLYAVVCSLLAELKDGHVQLLANGYKRFYAVPLPAVFPDSRYYENASEIALLFDLVKNRYLFNAKDSGSFFYGFISLRSVNKKIGYLYVPGFDRESFSFEFIDQAQRSFASCDGIIIDLRFNGGGSSDVLSSFINRYADCERLFLLSKIRNGARHGDFTDFIRHYMRPEAVNIGKTPLIVLVNRHTASSAEHFVLAMRTRPNTLIVGDSTIGALSTVVQRMAPNGWEYRTCPQVLYDTTGNILRNLDGQYPDGIGLAPDLFVKNYLREIYRGYDRVLATALNYYEEYFSEKIK